MSNQGWQMSPSVKPAKAKPAKPAKPAKAAKVAKTKPGKESKPGTAVTPMNWGAAPEASRPTGALPPAADAVPIPTPLPASPEAVVSTGPSGLLLGAGTHGPVSIRLFRPSPTRVAVAIPRYAIWLLAFRCISLGAHLSIYAQDRRDWTRLVDAVRANGGSADLLGPDDPAPSAGRPYRPSVIVDDADFYDGLQQPVGPWQALLMTVDVRASSSVFAMRSCEMTLAAPMNSKVSENLRRAYLLNPLQLKSCQELAAHEVALAMPRRAVKIAVPPTKMEYQLLFANAPQG